MRINIEKTFSREDVLYFQQFMQGFVFAVNELLFSP